jgi:predicted aspartyl protease
MYRLDFAFAHSYAAEAEGIAVPVVLKSGVNSVRLSASIDTGATFCIFRTELAEALGVPLEGGSPKRFRTANSVFDAFGHEVEISVLGVTTYSTVYFFADPAINKNVLGRVGWLDRVRLGLVEHDSQLYLAPYGGE